jgi:ankyrin repeat protein
VLSDCYASLESAKRHCGRGESHGPQHALSLIYLASNNLLDYRNTASAFEMICGSGNHDLLEAITTSESFAVKAIAKAFVPAAVRSGNIPLVKAILNLGIDPNSYDEATCCSPLGIAIKMRQVDMASTLLAYGADANGRSRTATLLAEAVETGSLELVQTMLSSGADVNAISTSTLWPRTTALHEAVKSGDIEITQLLLCCGADVDSLPDPAGRTLLWKAARTGNPTLVTLLLTCGANDSMSGLSAAIEAGSQEILQLLLVYGQHEPPNECYEGVDGKNIALQTAASVGDMGLVNFFLDIGAKVNALPPSSGKSALQAAVYAGHVDMVDRLLYLGANVNLEPAECGGMTALQQAVECENMELVGLLLDCGADINADPAEKNGYTALQAAISNGNLHLARYLIRLGADVNAYGCPGCSALELAVEHGRDNPDLLRLVLESGAKDALQWRYALETAIREYADLEIFEILLDYGFDVNERSDEDIPILVLALEGEVGADTEVLMLLLRHGAGDLDDALYVAARKDDIEHMELLLEWGANADAAPTPRNNHMTALSVAVRYNRGAAVQILLEECACDYEGALQQAARAGYTKFVKKFLRLGANVNASIPNDWNMETTALEYAAKSGNVDILRLLLDAGAKVDCEAVPRSCTTALQCAAMKGNLGVVDELLQRGTDVNGPPRGHSGRTALEGAAENGRLDIVQLLINVNADVGSSGALEFCSRGGS